MWYCVDSNLRWFPINPLPPLDTTLHGLIRPRSPWVNSLARTGFYPFHIAFYRTWIIKALSEKSPATLSPKGSTCRIFFFVPSLFTADCCLVDDIYTYNFVSQGKITIPSMDDSEEMGLTDVRSWSNAFARGQLTLRSPSATPDSQLFLYWIDRHSPTSSSVDVVIQSPNNFEIPSISPWHSVVCQPFRSKGKANSSPSR